MAQRIKKGLFGLLVCLIVFCRPLEVEASNGVGSISEFDSLTGNSKYLGKDYRNNYYIDIEETGIMDTGYEMLNSIANVLFGFIRHLVYLTCAIFYHSMAFDMGMLLTDFINGIQQELINSVFWPLFGIGMAFVSITVIKNLLKRNLLGSFLEFGKVLVLILLTFLFVKETDTVLTYTTQLTKEISLKAMMEISSSESETGTKEVKSYAASAAGVIWENMMHEPWLTVEFGEFQPSNEDVDELLTIKKGSREREVWIENYVGKDVVFDMARGAERISFLILYLFPCLLKCFIFICVSLMQLGLQVLALFYMFLVPIVLILAMFPDYGFIMVAGWWRKFLESQLGVLLMTFVVGLLIRMDRVLYSMAGQYGWLLVLIFECIIGIVLLKYHKEILNMIPKAGEIKGRVEDYAYRHRDRMYEYGPYSEPEYYREYSNPEGASGSYGRNRIRSINETETARSLSVYDQHQEADVEVSRPNLQSVQTYSAEPGNTAVSRPSRTINGRVNGVASVQEERDLSGSTFDSDEAEYDLTPNLEIQREDEESESDEETSEIDFGSDLISDQAGSAVLETAEEKPRMRLEPPKRNIDNNKVVDIGTRRNIQTDLNKRMGSIPVK